MSTLRHEVGVVAEQVVDLLLARRHAFKELLQGDPVIRSFAFAGWEAEEILQFLEARGVGGDPLFQKDSELPVEVLVGVFVLFGQFGEFTGDAAHERLADAVDGGARLNGLPRYVEGQVF